MPVVDLILRVLRRTHLVVWASSLLVVGLSLGGVRDYSGILQEARATRDLFESGHLVDLCGETAQRRADEIWEELLERAFPGQEETPEIGFSAHCPHPVSTRPIRELRAFLTEGLWVDVPSPDPMPTAAFLIQNRFMGPPDGVFVTWGGDVTTYWNDRVAMVPLTDEKMGAINAGEDSLDLFVSFVDTSGIDAPGAAPSPADSGAQVLAVEDSDSVLTDQDTDSAGFPMSSEATPTQSPPTSVSVRVGGSVSQDILGTREILGGDPRWSMLSSADDQGRALVFPQMQAQWNELAPLSPRQTIRYLEELEERDSGYSEFGRYRLDHRLLGWLGPTLPVLALLALALHVGHLRRMAAHTPSLLEGIPWIGLYEERVAAAMMSGTLALPSLAAVFVAYRVLPTEPLAGVWAILAAVLAGALTVRVLRDLAAMRASGES